jgi:hypothetical protein
MPSVLRLDALCTASDRSCATTRALSRSAFLSPHEYPATIANLVARS